jgi:hypothetical protein
VTNYTDPDGWLLVEDRAVTIGSPAQRMSRIIGHPIDIYRRRFPERTAGLDDLEVLALWHVDEVDRRLNEAGLTAQRHDTVWIDVLPDLDEWERGMLRHRLRLGLGIVRDPNAWIKVVTP